MASVNYNVNVSTAQGVQALQNLQSKVAQTNEVFGKLKSALGAIAVGSFIANAFQSANALTDMAKAANISTQALLGFTTAIKANGGESEAAINSIGKFSQAIESAAQGSKDMQDRFLKLGITLQDLRTLSEEDLLGKVVQGLGQGAAGAETMSIAMALFGKSFRSVDFKGVASDIKATTEAAAGAAAGYDAAGETTQRFYNSIGELQKQLIKALTPISELAASILSATDVISKFFQVAVQIGLVIATFTLLGKVVSVLRLGFLALGEAWAFLKTGVGTIVNLFRNFGTIMGEVSNASKLGGSALGVLRGLFAEFASWIAKNIPAIGALAVVLGQLWGALGDGINAIKEFLGFGEAQKKNSQDVATAEAKKAAQIREVTDALLKEKSALDNIVSAYKLANEQANKKYQAETLGITMSEKQKELYNQQLDSYNRYLSEFNKLQDQFNEKRVSGSESDKRMLPEISATMERLTQEYYKQSDALAVLVDARVREAQAKQLDLFNTKSLIDSQNKLQSIQDDIAKSTMSEIEKKYYDIDAAARASAKSAIEAEEARRNAKMPIEEQQQYYEAAFQGNEELKKQTKESYDNSRSAATGWSKAFNEYRDNATNAAEEAGRVFNIMAQGMEDALMGFIKKGTFAWKDFVQLMVDELLRSQIRQLIGNLGGGLQSVSSGIGGGIGKLLGFASGGIIPTNGPVVVGERGPELLMGAAGMNVIPNNQLGGASNVVYNISAVDAMSFKAMIARDPTFLYAVTEQGRRSLPGGR